MSVSSVAEVLILAWEHFQASRYAEAERLCGRIVEADPSLSDAWRLLGVLLADRGKLDKAAAALRQLILLDPSDSEAHNNLGFILDRQEKLVEANVHYREAIRLRPDYADARYNLAIVLQKQGELEQAAASFRQAVLLKPSDADAHNNLGVVLMELGRLDEAVACCQQASLLDSRHVAAHTNLGNALARQGKLDEAVRCHEQALRVNPTSAAACTNLGNVRRQQGSFDQALDWYNQAIRHDASYKEAHLNRAHVWLLLGQWARGWPEFEWRWQMSRQSRPETHKPRWDGSPLAGRTLLVTAEQGLGDTMQFVRFVSLAKQRGGSRTCSLSPLCCLLANVKGIDQLVAFGDPLPKFDVQAPLLSLPGLLRTAVENIPATVPYLQADAELVDHWRHELEPLHGFKVGIAWQGNPTYPGDGQRSISLEHLRRWPRSKESD